MYNGRGRSSQGPDYSKRFKSLARSRRGSVHRLLFRWLRRPSTFLLTGFCLLVVPPLWFVSRHTEPTSDFIVGDLDGGVRNNLRTSSAQETRRTEESSPTEPVRLPPPPPEPERVKVAARATPVPTPPPPLPPPIAPPPPPTPPPQQNLDEKNEDLDKENERIKRKHSEWRRKATMSPWQPPVLPVEVFRDVPPEECLRSPLAEKRVNPSDYEFGCEDIYVSVQRSLLAMPCAANTWSICRLRVQRKKSIHQIITPKEKIPHSTTTVQVYALGNRLFHKNVTCTTSRSACGRLYSLSCELPSGNVPLEPFRRDVHSRRCALIAVEETDVHGLTIDPPGVLSSETCDTSRNTIFLKRANLA